MIQFTKQSETEYIVVCGGTLLGGKLILEDDIWYFDANTLIVYDWPDLLEIGLKLKDLNK